MCGAATQTLIRILDNIRSQPVSQTSPTMKTSNMPELIPDSVGKGTTRKIFQNRTLKQWSFIALAGLSIYYQKLYEMQPSTRAAALGLVFPGAGFIACANVTSGLSFILTLVLLPVTLFAWFGAGGILFPILLWSLSILGAYFAAGERLFEPAGIVAAIGFGSFILWLNRFSFKARSLGKTKRQTRNEFIPNALAKIDSLSTKQEGARELDLESLRFVQYIIDQGFRGFDDWTDYKIIDQFQTSAIRYQLYEMMYTLGAYQGIYTPNFHGYLNTSFRNIIEKSLTQKVLNFWKWESLWGKFTTNWDPVREDNIMVTGFLLQGIMLYTANTGDLRYTKPGSMKFQVTNKAIYPHSIHSMDKTLVDQWKSNPYCFFPCEPNWIYTPCNFQGMTGQIIYDRFFKTSHAAEILPRFEASLNSDFTEESGSILPIRSSLTGFTIPGLCGALTDLANAIMTRGYLDHVARRMYAVFKTECIVYDEKSKELELTGLVGADNIDPGTYQASPWSIYAMLSEVAADYGDEEIRVAAVKKVKENVGVETRPTGAKRLTLSKASPSTNTLTVKGMLLRCEDWKDLIGKGPSPTTLGGPILSEVPYPGVLVAKAYSQSSKDLELVLYPSAEAGTFTIGVEKLEPGVKYSVGEEKAVVADKEGKVRFDVEVNGRTAVLLTPAESK